MKPTKGRRDFVKVMVSVGGTLTAVSVPSFLLEACKPRRGSTLAGAEDDRNRALAAAAGPGPRQRNSAFQDNDNMQRYARAFRQLQSTAQGRQVWEAFATVHQNCCPHGNWFFLPWHRVYLHYFEKMIRDVLRTELNDAAAADAFMLPYWDWDKNPGIPPVAFTKATAANTADLFWEKRSAESKKTGGRIDAQFVGPQAIQTVLGSNDFIAFASGRAKGLKEGSGGQGALERMPHNMTHVWVGGNDGDMASFMSPRDPVFWLHHCNVDRMWATWAAARRARNLSEIPPNTVFTPIKTSTWLNFNLNGAVPGAGATNTYVQYNPQTRKAELVKADAFTVQTTIQHWKAPFNFTYPQITAGLNLDENNPNNPANNNNNGGDPNGPGQGGVTTTTPPTDAAYAEVDATYSAATEEAPFSQVGRVFEFIDTKSVIFALDLDKITGKDSTGATVDAKAILGRFQNVQNKDKVGFSMYLSNVPKPKDPNAKLFFYLNHKDKKRPTEAEMDAKFLGAFVFFGHDHAGHTGGIRLNFDLARVLRNHPVAPDAANNVFVAVAIETAAELDFKLKEALGSMGLALEYHES